jgi:hypothetical protein
MSDCPAPLGIPEDIELALKPSKHSNEDGPIAYPALKPGAGVAWQLNLSIIVTRRELSDALLEALERRRSAFLKYWADPHRRESGEPPPKSSNP